MPTPSNPDQRPALNDEHGANSVQPPEARSAAASIAMAAVFLAAAFLGLLFQR